MRTRKPTPRSRTRSAAARRLPIGRRIHIHCLNTPDIAAYAVPPEALARRLEPIVRRFGVSLTVTESHDLSEIPPPMSEATVLVGFELPTRRIGEVRGLEWIHLISAGVDHLLPLDWLPPSVALTNSSGVHSELAGEYAAGALLMLNIGMPRHATNQRAGNWDQVFNSPIRGKTLVLIGVGAIGGAAATQAKRLGLRVLGVRRSRRSHPDVDEIFAPEQLHTLLPRADFVLITAPLTAETRHLIGAKELDLLPRTAGLMNISRAELVDYDALRVKLERSELRGAIVDVCHPEPLPADSPLWRVPNFMITPHISSDPIDYVERTMAIIADNLRRLLARRPLRNLVDRSRGY